MKTATEQVLELAEAYEQMPHVLLREANRKSKRNRKSEPRTLSGDHGNRGGDGMNQGRKSLIKSMYPCPRDYRSKTWEFK